MSTWLDLGPATFSGAALSGAAATGSLLVAVFSASLLGSVHCMGMCGPFVAFYSASGPQNSGKSLNISAPSSSCKDVKTTWGRGLSHLGYHGGRALTYVSLGALGGFVGKAIDWAGEAAGLVSLAAIVSSLLVILWGLGALFPRFSVSSPLTGMLGRKFVQLGTKPRVFRASLLGVFTPLLPCGWLYAFVVTAAGTGSAASGALVMTAFWLGTVPALLGVGALMNKVGDSLRRRLPIISGAALVTIGVLGIVLRLRMPLPEAPAAPSGADASSIAEEPSCH